jgi:periplasmic protein TonB
MNPAIWLSPADVRLTDAEAVPRERRRFSAAMLMSGLFHALLLALLIGLWVPAPEETHAPIPITLRAGDGASGAAGGGNSTVAASAASAASENPSPQQSAEAQTPPAETTAPQPTVTPTAAPPTPALAQAAEPSLPVTETAEPVPLRKPAPPHPPQMIAQAQPPTPAIAASAASTAAPGSDAVTNEGAGGRGRGNEGAGRAAIGDGSPNALGDDYLEKVRRWLARYQKMPEEAAQKKQYGTAIVEVVIDRDGNVLNALIDQSSGYPLLDEATLKMVHDASPLPKVPGNHKPGKLQIDFAIPANFKPGFFERLFH